MKKFLLPLALAALQMAAAAASFGHPATVREYDRVFTTYPYSDPDAVPKMSMFYPYFRYDGFTNGATQKKWKVVELSNDYLQVLILPEIGGKVWAAIEKSTGRSFVYFNHAVKFRDVSMRGPWTSGGMEANYGIMGHTPNCFSPVDYCVRRNADGSASCIIGVLDLLTRTTWRLEIRLPAAAACFSTRSFWHNASGADQPYYTWMNVGIKAAGNLQFVDPGNHYLGHDGAVSDWPINPANGHDLSWYEQNNFGSYKSYHVFGQLAEFFGGYWHDDDFGIARSSAYADKPGRKIWIWGLSREGMIWENLLSDTDGQYVEIQSGRLFNQTAENSSLTPFKHREFAPYASDVWTEYWQPVKGIKGFVTASPWGAMNVTRENGRLVIGISPARALQDKLEILDGDRVLYAKGLKLNPMQPIEEIVPLAVSPQRLRVTLGGDKLQYAAGKDDVLSRPLAAPANFDWQSPYGLYLKGKEKARQRLYSEAGEAFQACLTADPNFLPALVEMAGLANRRADYLVARDYARKALSIDTYDPEANYQFGQSSAGLGLTADAEDAFSIAALSPAWRSPASTELAKVFLREKQYARALACAGESLDSNVRNLEALQLRACIWRLQGNIPQAAASLQAIFELDPLNHFRGFENYLLDRGSLTEFTGMIRNELPHETYLELAAWYRNAGLDADADQVLELAPPTAEVLFWRAYLRQDAALLARAEAASPAFVFPFRTEAVPVFEWAMKQDKAWQPRYFLALIRWFQGEMAPARQLLEACGDEPRFGPFYAARAQVCETTAERDLRRAIDLDPGQWRYGEMLARHYLKQGDAAAALGITTQFARTFPNHGTLSVLHAKALAANGRYPSVVSLLDGLQLLPCEGSTEARGLYRNALLMVAVRSMQTNAFGESLRLIESARQWPEHLGAGKPYPEDSDERIEDWLSYQCYRGEKNQPLAGQALKHILDFQPGSRSTGSGAILRALALKESGRGDQAEQLLKNWREEAPESELAKWGAEFVAGQAAPLPKNIQDGFCRVLALWRGPNRP